MSTSRPHVAIIGAGPAGLCLAVSLSHFSVPCTIYEANPSPSHALVKSSVVLSPNGLRILRTLGLYDRLVPLGYSFEGNIFKNANLETVDAYWYGHEKLYEYKALRIYRERLVDVLRNECEKLGVKTMYGSRFSSILQESDDAVDFVIIDAGGNERTESASMLVGADGINSSLRSNHISPATKPTYAGVLALYTDISSSAVEWPDQDFPRACTILGGGGAVMVIPCVPDASTLVAIRQYSHPDMTRDEWSALAKNKDKLREMILQNRETWNDVGKSIINAMADNHSEIALWNFQMIPKLERWASAKGRAVLIGDAAHAIPPSSGQGINQAFEDAFSLALLLSKQNERPSEQAESLTEDLKAWQSWRQGRLDKIMTVIKIMQAKRLPEAERKALAEKGLLKDMRSVEESEEELRWLYQPDIAEAIQQLIKKSSKVQ